MTPSFKELAMDDACSFIKDPAGRTSLIVGSMLIGLLTAAFAVAPQIHLLMERGDRWNGSYAITDFDEPFYAAYLQSIIEGKPRRNSPYTGAVDTKETPQMESHLSIQFMATYPMAFISRALSLSPSGSMIGVSLVYGFLSGFALFFTFYMLLREWPAAYVGTVVVLFFGAMAAGQGSFFNLITDLSIHYLHPLIFLRRTLPAAGFPILFLFIVSVWKSVTAEKTKESTWWCIIAGICFFLNVFTYFYFWTTALAWFGAFAVVWAIFRWDDLRAKKWILFGLLSAIGASLVPYFVLLQNRSVDVDTALTLEFTREPDLFRISEILGYIAILALIFAHVTRRLSLGDSRSILLFSLALVGPVVFNQQILTGRTLQPFHYEFYCANYTSVLSLAAITLFLMRSILTVNNFHRLLLGAGMLALVIGVSDTIAGIGSFRKINVQRDESMPAMTRLSELRSDEMGRSTTVLSFDLIEQEWPVNIDIPSLTSHSVLWGIHLSMFPDVGKTADTERLFKYLYYHNFDRNKLLSHLYAKNTSLVYAFFGADRTLSLYAGELKSIENDEIVAVADAYEQFRNSFDYDEAKEPEISFLLLDNNKLNDLAAVDRWYERVREEEFGKYIIYHLKLREPPSAGLVVP